MKSFLCSDSVFALLISVFCGILISCSKPEQTCKINLIDDSNYPDCLFVPVTINGTSVRFLFDTGTSHTTMDSLLADKLGVNAVGNWIGPLLTGIDQTKIADSTAYAKVKYVIGNFRFSGDISLGGQKLAKMLPNNGTILGMNTIKQVYWLFDFADNTVTISKDKIAIPALTDDKILTLDFYLNSDSITYTDVTIDGQSFQNILFDTGYRTALFASDKKRDIDIIFSESDYIAYTSNLKFSAIEMKIDGKSHIFTDSMQINNCTMRSLIALKAYKGVTQTVITANFIHRFRMMYIDSKNRKIQFYVSPSDSARYQRKDIQDFIREMHKDFQDNGQRNVNLSQFGL